MQDPVEETLGALVLGILEEVLGGADLDYAALVHEDHPVGYAPREAHLVGDDYHRHTASCEVGHRFEDLVDRSEEHTSELQSRQYLVCRLLLEKKHNQYFVTNNLQTMTI